jgi:hypothetical protein
MLACNKFTVIFDPSKRTKGKNMKQFDVLVENKGKHEVVCEMFAVSVETAVAAVKTLRGYSKAKYVGHVMFEVVSGKWEATETVNMNAVMVPHEA